MKPMVTLFSYSKWFFILSLVFTAIACGKFEQKDLSDYEGVIDGVPASKGNLKLAKVIRRGAVGSGVEFDFVLVDGARQLMIKTYPGAGISSRGSQTVGQQDYLILTACTDQLCNNAIAIVQVNYVGNDMFQRTFLLQSTGNSNPTIVRDVPNTQFTNLNDAYAAMGQGTIGY